MKKAISLTTTSGESLTILSTEILVVEAYGANYKVVYKDFDNNIKAAIVTDTLADIQSAAECLYELEGVYLSVYHTEFVAGNSSGSVVGYKTKNFSSSDAKDDVIERINIVAGVKANSAVALTDAATMDLSGPKHTLASSSATRTFTISYTGDDITLEVTLTNTAATYTFPATALCTSEGTASGDNTCSLSGVSGDKYIIGIKKIGSSYYVAAKNFGQ